ncbi:MAG: nucleotidyltransferase family protein [Candidatus Omnitrophota bacterium]|nr:MAG: nucleotidyltransferase family protein [Candidatus Omnitrophota bacterium]
MNIVILAAGYGTRLYPLTLNTPKPLLAINGKPIINFLIEKIERLRSCFPVKEVRIVSNNKFYNNFSQWKRKYKVKAKIINDGSNSPDDRKGAIGDIKFAIGAKRGDWLILGGDNLFEDDLVQFVKFALKMKPYPSVGLYDVREKNIARRFGVVKVDSARRILDLEEKPKDPPSTLIATCIYFFPQMSLNFFDLYLNQESYLDASGKYIEWLTKKTKVYGHTSQGSWFDIGHRDALRWAEKKFK